MMWSLRLFIASLLAAIGFPKVLATERLLPGKPDSDIDWDDDRSWTHNLKDDLAAWIKSDTEWWMKFYNFTLYTQAALIVLLLVLA